MFSINRVTLIGFLGKDAEVKRMRKNESSYTVLSLATNRSWKDRESGKYKSKVYWYRCIAFGQTGAAAAKLLKGARVQIEGEIRTHEYNEKNGNETVKKTITEICVYRIAKLDRPSADGASSLAAADGGPA